MRSTLSGSQRSAAEGLNLGLLAQVRPTYLLSPPVILDIEDSRGERRGTIELEAARDFSKRDEFTADFCRDLTRLEQWAAGQAWTTPAIPEFRVVVSERFKISRSLVPAWSGQAGHMEFPAWRVAARKAAIAHELVHVYFPNGNRLLAEGLAIHLQAVLGGNPAFPNFGRPLHEVVGERLRGMAPGFSSGNPAGLDPIRLVDPDAIATPNPLTLRVGDDFYGEEPRGQYLIETRGLESFRALHERTPMLPLHQNSGSPERWIEVDGVSLSRLESDWKALIASMN